MQLEKRRSAPSANTKRLNAFRRDSSDSRRFSAIIPLGPQRLTNCRVRHIDEKQTVLPTSAQRKQLQQLGEQVRRLWEHPRVSRRLKQQLVRILIEEIIVDVDEDRDEVVLLIQWSGGHHTELREPRKYARGTLPPEQLRLAVTTLRKVLDDAGMAAVLNREGIRTATGQTWTLRRVRQYRHQQEINAFSASDKAAAGWLTQAETATRLEISAMSVHRLVRSGIISAEQPHPGLPMVICQSILENSEVQRAVTALKSGQTLPLTEDPRQLKLY